MGSPLAPVMGGIFMVELGRKVLPMLLQYIKGKKRYADDTISYVKVDCTEHVLCIESFPCKYFFYLWARMWWYDFFLRCFNYEKEQ